MLLVLVVLAGGGSERAVLLIYHYQAPKSIINHCGAPRIAVWSGTGSSSYPFASQSKLKVALTRIGFVIGVAGSLKTVDC